MIEGIPCFIEQKEIDEFDSEEKRYNKKIGHKNTGKLKRLNFYIRRTPHEVLLLKGLKGKVGLEIGVGIGKNRNFEHTYAKVTSNIVAVDVSSTALKRFKREFPKCTAILATRLPYRKECFDFITASGVIHHIIGQSKDLTFFFSEWHRVLKKGGVFISNDPNLLYPTSLLMHIPNRLLQKLKPGARGRVPYERPILYSDVKKTLSKTKFKNISVAASTFCHYYMPEAIIRYLMKTEAELLTLYPFRFFGHWITVYAEKR